MKRISSAALVIFVFCLLASDLPGQRISVAPRIPTLTAHQPISFDFRLEDLHGAPYVPAERVPLKVEFSGALRESHTLVFLPGELTKTLQVPGSPAGTVQVNASIPQMNSSTTENYKIFRLVPAVQSGARSFVVRLSVRPSKLLLFPEKAKIVAQLTDGNRPIEAPKQLRVFFPGIDENIKPHPLEIKANDNYGETTFTPNRAGIVQLKAVVEPSMISGRPVSIDDDTVEFLPAVKSIRLNAAQRYLTSYFFRPSVAVTATLLDAMGNPVKADGDRTIYLTVDPPQQGQFADSKLVIKAGTSSESITYVPYQDGNGKIHASAGELTSVDDEVTFQYPFWGGPFLFIALVGAFLGTLLRYWEQADLQQKALKASDFWKRFLLPGLVGGVLAYLFGATLLRTEFQQALLASASKPLVGLYWGIVGGYLGPLVIVRGLAQKPKSENA